MTNYPVEFNGEDFSDIVHKRGYQTDRQPVYGAQYTDLDLNDHYVVTRWRGGLSLPINDLPAERAAQLAARLMESPLQVTYYSFQLRKKVTETMGLEKMPQRLKLQTKRADWLAVTVLSFREV